MYPRSIGSKFRIGIGSFIDAKKISIGENVRIGNLVRIKLLDELTIGACSSIAGTTVICGTYERRKMKTRAFLVGEHCSIMNSHSFDCTAPIIIGNRVCIAGSGSQFYTHSFDLQGNRLDKDITIGDHVYIGAGCIVNLGCSICNNVVLQSGTCVNKSINCSGVYTSNTFMKCGEVRDYTELFKDTESVVLQSGTKVFYKDSKLN